MEEPGGVDFTKLLPVELIVYILSHLGLKDLCNASRTSSLLARLATDNSVWEPLFRSFFPFTSPHRLEDSWKKNFVWRTITDRNWAEQRPTKNHFLSEPTGLYMLCAVWDQDMVITGDRGNSLIVWPNPLSETPAEKIWIEPDSSVGQRAGIWVICLALTKDKRILTGHYEGQLMEWQLSPTTITHLRTVPGHADRVRAMQWYNDSTLISCSWEQAIKLWDPDTLNCKHQINSGHTSFVYDIDIQGEELLSCSADRTVKLWDLNKEGAHVHTFATSDSNDDDWVLSVRWHPDKNTILCGESHGIVRIWDKRTVDPVHLLKLPPTPFTHNHVWGMAAVDNKLITGSRDGRVNYFDLRGLSQGNINERPPALVKTLLQPPTEAQEGDWPTDQIRHVQVKEDKLLVVRKDGLHFFDYGSLDSSI